MDKILCIRTIRSLRNDFTIAHKGKLYQIEQSVKAKEVTVEERINGSMFITHDDAKLQFKEITARPAKPKKTIHARRHKVITPPTDHPWRKLDHKLYRKMRFQGQKPLAATTL